MFKKLLGTTLGSLPPRERLNILLPIIALFVLATVITGMWSKIGAQASYDLKEKDVQIQFWQHQSELKDHKIDSLVNKSYNDKIETNKELRIIIEHQNNQKQLLRNLK